VRYAPLLGSLTSLGIVIGCYILLTQLIEGWKRWVTLVIIVISGVSSLSKAAIVNICIGIAFIAYANRKPIRRRVLFAAGGITMAAYLLWASMPMVRNRIIGSLQSFGISVGTGHTTNYDATVVQGAWDRLTSLPKANFNALQDLHSPFAYFTGGGFGMGSTALVPASDSIAPMAHNQFMESITVFGFAGGTIQIMIMIYIGYRLARLRQLKSPTFQVMTVVYLLFMLNSMFANGTLYQPGSASIFYLVFFASISRRLEMTQRPDRVITQPIRTKHSILDPS